MLENGGPAVRFPAPPGRMRPYGDRNASGGPRLGLKCDAARSSNPTMPILEAFDVLHKAITGIEKMTLRQQTCRSSPKANVVPARDRGAALWESTAARDFAEQLGAGGVVWSV